MTFYGTHPFVGQVDDYGTPTEWCERCGGPRRAHEAPREVLVDNPEPDAEMGGVKVYTMEGIAAVSGLAAKTIRVYRSQGRMPPPDGMVGGVPWWRTETIDAWLDARTPQPRSTLEATPDMVDATGTPVFTIKGVAAAARLSVSSIRVYRSQGRMPDPDGKVGHVPYWREETILPWLLEPRRRGGPNWFKGMPSPGPRRKRPVGPDGG